MTPTCTIAFITDERFGDHVTDAEHPEVPDRLRALRERLVSPRWGELLQWLPSRPATRTEVLRVHTDNYLLRLEETCLSGREWFGHPDNKICYESYSTAFLAAGAGLKGIDSLEGGFPVLPFCAVRPPGHHAEPSLALGFCFLNNAAIAARYWQELYQRRRIGIIDWDAHHGNGIQEIFEQDPDVLYVSIHEHPTFSFPGTGYAEDKGSGAGLGATLNIPLAPGAGRAEVMQALRRQVEPAVDAFRPEALIIAAGFDGHAADDMSGLAYPTELYEELGELMAAWSRRFCEGRVLSILEGGYNLETLTAGVEAYLTGLLPPLHILLPGVRTMYIATYMSRTPLSISPATLLPQARELLQRRNFRHLPVVDDQKRLLGMITDRDLRSAYPSSVLPEDKRSQLLSEIAATPVERIMATELTTLSPTSTLDDALLIFERRRVGAIPVVDEEGRLAGIFSIRDLLQAYGSVFGLGEKGSSLVEIRDQTGSEILERLIRVLVEHKINFTRLVRARQEGVIHVRVNTYNIRQLHKLLTEAGLEVVTAPEQEKK